MVKLRVGELLKKGIQFASENPILLLLVLLLVGIPSLMIRPDPANLTPLLIYLFCSFWVTIFLTGLIVRFIYESGEEQPSWNGLIKFTFSKYFLLLLVFAVYVMATTIGVFLFVIPGIFLSIRLILCDYGILLENEGVGESIKRSWLMTKGNWWRLFGLFLTIHLLSTIFSFFSNLLPRIIYAPISLLLGALTFVWFQASFTFAYLQLRKQKE